jgi:hypothetical protein
MSRKSEIIRPSINPQNANPTGDLAIAGVTTKNTKKLDYAYALASAMALDLERNVHACLRHSKLLANEVAILSKPALHIIAVSLEPMDLGSNGVKALFYSTVVTLFQKSTMGH